MMLVEICLCTSFRKAKNFFYFFIFFIFYSFVNTCFLVHSETLGSYENRLSILSKHSRRDMMEFARKSKLDKVRHYPPHLRHQYEKWKDTGPVVVDMGKMSVGVVGIMV